MSDGFLSGIWDGLKYMASFFYGEAATDTTNASATPKPEIKVTQAKDDGGVETKDAPMSDAKSTPVDPISKHLRSSSKKAAPKSKAKAKKRKSKGKSKKKELAADPDYSPESLEFEAEDED